MKHEGPTLESLTHRLAETPEDFLAEPRIGPVGRIHVGAVIGDLLESFGKSVAPAVPAAFVSSDARKDRNRLSISLLLCWLLADDWFRQNNPDASAIVNLLHEAPLEWAKAAASRKYIEDPDRREEMVRTALARLGFRPAGESVAQAQDRLMSISSVERARVMQSARAAEERARAIRAALARKAAQESADKFTRE